MHHATVCPVVVFLGVWLAVLSPGMQTSVSGLWVENMP